MKLSHILFAAFAATALLTSCNAPKDDGSDDATTTDNGNVIAAIATRASVRTFTADTVSAADIETLLRAAMAAPTARDCRPWSFVVVNDTALIAKLLPGHGDHPGYRATVAIAVCGNTEKMMEGDGRDFWIQDVSAATENLLVQANAMGLGAVWTSVWPIEKKIELVKEVLNLPENLIPLAVVPVGYPTEQPKVKDKWDPENIHYNKF